MWSATEKAMRARMEDIWPEKVCNDLLNVPAFKAILERPWKGVRRAALSGARDNYRPWQLRYDELVVSSPVSFRRNLQANNA